MYAVVVCWHIPEYAFSLPFAWMATNERYTSLDEAIAAAQAHPLGVWREVVDNTGLSIFSTDEKQTVARLIKGYGMGMPVRTDRGIFVSAGNSTR